ncbi:PLP-dependent aminotransferase family protein [Bacillus salitolerans]|uniref:PLP-dependent aminotransferase family protein n=1 Tax=Bacillus salitolerans TaxID=1437434 RepID=A0ABW4LTT8_9BACI
MIINIDWKPDKTSKIPIYIQIKEYIHKKIINGEWTVGMKIPSQRKLAELLEVNRSTVMNAFEELIADGFLEGNTGNGTRVKNNLWSLFQTTSPPNWNHYVENGIYKPNLPTIQDIHKVEPQTNIIRLGTGEPSPEMYPKDIMGEVLKTLSTKIEIMGYEEEKGLPQLRKQLCHYLETLGINATPSSILVVSGALQALQLISLGLLRGGSTLLLENPSYVNSLNVFQSLGIKLANIPMDRNGMDTSFIKSYKRRYNASLVYTNPTFHNPTGNVMTLERRKHLLTVCEEEQLPIIEDDVYRELWIDTPPPPALKSMDNNGSILYIGSISKALSPGLRIGWIVGPEQVINRLADIKMQTDYGSSSLSQWAVTEWLESGKYVKHLESMREALRLRRSTAIRVLQNEFVDIAEWTVPSGGFYIWLRLPPTISIKELFYEALAFGILLNPGKLYDEQSFHYLRLSYSYASLFDLEKGIKKLGQIIRKLINN